MASRGLWNEARFRFEKAVALAPENAHALNNLAVALEQQGSFDKAREAYEKALKIEPGNMYIQQNYDLFREADDKRNRKSAASRILSALLRRSSWAAGCSSFVEVPVETPLQSKIDVTSFRRVLVAGFVTEPGESDVELGSETTRLLQNQLRSSSRLQVLEPDHPPLHDALEKMLEKLGEGGKYTKDERDQYRWSRTRSSRTPSSGARWARSSSSPLIVTGRWASMPRTAPASRPRSAWCAIRPAAASGWCAATATSSARATRLNAEFQFVDGRSGQTLHKEKFTEEVLYGGGPEDLAALLRISS